MRNDPSPLRLTEHENRTSLSTPPARFSPLLLPNLSSARFLKGGMCLLCRFCNLLRLWSQHNQSGDEQLGRLPPLPAEGPQPAEAPTASARYVVSPLFDSFRPRSKASRWNHSPLVDFKFYLTRE